MKTLKFILFTLIATTILSCSDNSTEPAFILSNESLAGDYDITVLNIDIEDLGGLSVCATIKKMFTESQIHILALTQLHSPEAVLDAGADQCLRKPMAAEAFLGAIQEMMGASVMA